MQSLAQMLQHTPYESYTYAYPHKTAYRQFATPLRLDEIWAQEELDRRPVFLYIHVPFCEMRCGFCNLFTTIDHAAQLSSGYLDAVQRQAEQVRTALGPLMVARMALGGGTPTYLALADLARLFNIAERLFAVRPTGLPISVETSPLTAEPTKLRLLRERGVDRISIGVQSFNEAEAHAAGRPQQTATVLQALDAIRATAFPTLNIDLIYGLPGQTVTSWLASIETALRYRPEELYLYPLYVRPLTGLARTGKQPENDELRLTCYREARALLLAHGYMQESMRMFRAAHAPAESGPVYCVQDDGMVGLGCGARSYTHRYHYSNEYAVGARGVRAILSAYIGTSAADFAYAHYGFMLDRAEQQRRYVLKSLLEAGGLNLTAYEHRFGSAAFADLPELGELIQLDLATQTDELLALNAAGIERSDTIGPWLYSSQVRTLMGGYALR